MLAALPFLVASPCRLPAKGGIRIPLSKQVGFHDDRSFIDLEKSQASMVSDLQ